MKQFKLTTLGAALAVMTVVAVPLVTALPASADEYRMYANDVGHGDGHVRAFDGVDHFGHRRTADFEHMRFREHARFHSYRWNWSQRDHGRFER